MLESSAHAIKRKVLLGGKDRERPQVMNVKPAMVGLQQGNVLEESGCCGGKLILSQKDILKILKIFSC